MPYRLPAVQARGQWLGNASSAARRYCTISAASTATAAIWLFFRNASRFNTL